MKLTDILREEVEKKSHDKARIDVTIGLLHKAMNHLTSAVRDIESAAQYVEDEEKRDQIEDFKQSLLDDFGSQYSKFDKEYDGHDKLINRIGKFIDDNSDSAWNFNLNNDKEDEAPEGNYVHGKYPGLEDED
jgi:hypothetical protein|tara:strand:- start:979 stop:1374 length:396 start_codon:yes stop_codon:yes gene_type:complete